MLQDRRAQPRERIALPLSIPGGPGAVTRDVGAAGLFFVLPGHHVLRGPVHFELRVRKFSMKFSACGDIVRIEHSPAVTGVAVRFTHVDLARDQELGGRPGR